MKVCRQPASEAIDRESNAADVAVCGVISSFFHSTVSPFLISIVAGESFMPIANDKSRRPERTEAIRILKPPISNIPKSVSATVAAHAKDTVNELGKRAVTAPV